MDIIAHFGSSSYEKGEYIIHTIFRIHNSRDGESLETTHTNAKPQNRSKASSLNRCHGKWWQRWQTNYELSLAGCFIDQYLRLYLTVPMGSQAGNVRGPSRSSHEPWPA